ncbi:hypothetical protein [Sporanaerobacter sp. PP17-6a]|uniref:hypothetical protein n=1 Tax=Sporanaerobacter sp. PP17-6a TaxID=1891289 RepID=UPI0008A01D25|nr:hypothetical protein [Sporanaerobacter sp. PP17-6a]SCL87943.1 hypothetical protein PP176A_1427 [Sporanaerobacter sp. PP17-6a]
MDIQVTVTISNKLEEILNNLIAAMEGKIATQQPVQQPVQPIQPENIPIQTISYTMEQLAVAATQLMDAGKRNELIGLLGQFGVQALTALPKKQYGAFATKLREMGAKI